MNISEFIKNNIFLPRLQQTGSLVIYDPDSLYREICLSIENEKFTVVDASISSIEARLAAFQGLRDIVGKQLAGVLVYIPKSAPLTEEEKQKDPFAPIAVAGAIFPEGDGDSFESICLKAKPDHAMAIRTIFEQNSKPSFAVIDAIGSGLGWPNLRALLKEESARDILQALLVPNEKQKEALKTDESWLTEAKDLFLTTLALKIKTRSKAWDAVSNELWRYIVFSEFVFDLPSELPLSLSDVPRAEYQAKALIEDICDSLRNDQRTRHIYIDQATEIEKELNLIAVFDDWNDLGEKDTFPFEERTFLNQAINSLLRDELDHVKHIYDRHSRSVWIRKGESRAQWDLIYSATQLLQICHDMEGRFSENSKDIKSLVVFYTNQFREVDRLHREFEQAVSDYEWQDTYALLLPVKKHVRKQYGQLVAKVQIMFMRQVEQNGWPLTGFLTNTDVFDTIVAPKLKKNGHKVAYLMVDALRYELGVELQKQLADDGIVNIQPALAQLPSITLVGMASLLPGASQKLYLKNEQQSLVPMIGEDPVSTVAQRMGIFQKKYGQRFDECRLEDFVRQRDDFSSEIDLLVLRSVEIDSHFENSPDTAPTEILKALQRIRVAIHKLKARGFHDIVIATDHGFFMNTHAGAGDTCPKPQGNWLTVHERCALGEGLEDNNHLILATEKMAIKSDFNKFAAPYSFAAYRTGLQYYHGGLSLQECIVPVITLQLKASEQPVIEKASIVMSYKNGAKYITTRMPVIDLSAETTDMFSLDNDFEILLEAHDKNGNIVGEAKVGGHVNAATGTLTLKPGDKVQVTIKMQMDFEGKFKLKALNPATYIAYCQIDLETDYAV